MNTNPQLAAPYAAQSPLDVGFHHGITAAKYHADPCPAPSLSSGTLRTLLSKSAAHAALEHPRLGKQKREASAAMETGSLIHAILSGNLEEVAIHEFADFRTKAAQTWRDEQRALGKVPVSAEDYEQAQKVANLVINRAAVGISNSPFGDGAATEVTAVWQEDGAYCRARYDALVMDDYTADVWDWKSCRDISDRGIEKAISSHRYDIQQAFYLRGLQSLAPSRVLSFTFVFFEPVAPYTVRRVVLSPTYVAEATKKICEGIRAWAECIAKGEWPVTPADTLTVEIPAFLDESEAEIIV